MKCKNCEQDFEGNFCNNCGQKQNTRRINFRYLLEEIPNSVFQVNRGLLFTIKELFTRPGHSIREFLEGKRNHHFKPLAFVFLVSTIYVLSNYWIGNDTFLDDMISGFRSSANEHDETQLMSTLDWITDHQTYATVLFLPFFSLASYLAFVRSEYNYVEHLVLNFFITGQQTLIYLMFSFITNRSSGLTMIPFVLGFAFNIWAYSQFFNNKKAIWKILLMVLMYVFYILFFILLIGALALLSA